MLGNEAEFLLRSLGFEDLRATFDSKQLVATATQINPQRLESVAGTFKKFRGWSSYQSVLIIRRVYGLDYLIDIGANRIGFCFTTNPDLVATEVKQAQTYSSLWKSLGVTKVMVLFFVYPVGEGLTFYDKDRCQDNMLGVILNALEDSLEVTSAEVRIEFE